MLSFTNLSALFFLVLALFLFYRYPSFSSMAEGSPKSIYDFTVKVYPFWGFPCSWVFKFWFWFFPWKLKKDSIFIAYCFWGLYFGVIWFHICNTHLLFWFLLLKVEERFNIYWILLLKFGFWCYLVSSF